MNALLLGLLVFRVTRPEPRRVGRLVAGVVLFLGCASAWLVAVELLWVGIVGLGVQGWASLGDWGLVAGALLLAALGGVGIKDVLQSPAPRWAIALATLTALLIAIVQNALQFLPIG